MSDLAIRAEGISKLYRIQGLRPRSTLRDVMWEKAAALTGRRAPPEPETAAPILPGAPEDLWALRDVSFTVSRGDTVGLVGANGSGKSTLLKVVSRIVAPTRGRASIRGRVGALLEVGTGFHPELTGRDNIFLNGSILGMTASEIRSRFDQIVDFAGVERFLGLPIKRYSSGMALRLAFAVAAHLEPDVLIVDEVLAVGDAEFQRKCLARMDEVAQSGCTIFFVSHNLAAVQRLCTRGLLMEAGRLVCDGRAGDIIDRYLSSVGARVSPHEWTELPRSTKHFLSEAHLGGIRYYSPIGAQTSAPQSLGPLRIDIRAESVVRFSGRIAVTISDQLGTRLITADSHDAGTAVTLPPGHSEWRFDIDRLYLKPGRYVVGLLLVDAHGRIVDNKPTALQIDVGSADGLASQDEDDLRNGGLVPCRFEVSSLEVQPVP